MAPKRGGRSTRLPEKNIDYSHLKLSESLCPICRSILIEPVTLACNHGFCLACFEGTMANSNLVCPLCRLRIGSWLRSAKKENKLINIEYWVAIKKQFPEQVKNKLDGLEEDLAEETPPIKIADPGEIRKEYEVQKRKNEDEFFRLKALEEKASESLLKKFQEELEYEKAVEEEKIKFDEQIARKLAEKLAAEAGPSTPKSGGIPKKLGTLDAFVKSKMSMNVPGATKMKTSNSKKMTFTPNMQKNLDSSFNCNVMLNNSLNNFATKEYTCIVLKQNKLHEQSDSFNNLSFIKKKCQQLQKLTEAEYVSDSSDCIESECRYFKPIDYKYNPRSSYKPAIRVPSKIITSSTLNKIRPPNGKKLFSYSDISAFARVHSPLLCLSENINNEKEAVNNENRNELYSSCILENSISTSSKRKSENPSSDSRKKLKLSDESSDRTPEKLNGFTAALPSVLESPPFCGFKKNNLRAQINNKKLSLQIDSEALKKRLQEKADLEFAKKLHEELNNHARYPTRSNLSKKKSRRQVTLDEIISPCKIKY